MRRGRLRVALVRLHLYRMDQIGKLDRVLDEEHRNVVADQIPVAFIGVELHRKTAHIAGSINRTSPACNRREPGEKRRFLALLGKKTGTAQLGDWVGHQNSKGRRAPAWSTFGYARDLIEMKIFPEWKYQQCRTRSHPQLSVVEIVMPVWWSKPLHASCVSQHASRLIIGSAMSFANDARGDSIWTLPQVVGSDRPSAVHQTSEDNAQLAGSSWQGRLGRASQAVQD